LQGFLVITLVWLIVHKKKNGNKLTEQVCWVLLSDFFKPQSTVVIFFQEKQAIIDRYHPEPLVGDTPEDHPALSPRVVSGRVGKHVTVDGKKCLNLATHNYLGLLEDETIQEAASKALRKYGVGSCGPRGFYGTVDVHLALEEKIAEFMQLEEAVVYSYAFSTIASAIPAYCKRSDVVFVDEAVNFSIQKGLDASRSRVTYFKHNDMADLERCLLIQQKLDEKNPRRAAKTRRFLIAEAIYLNTGEMCPLAELVELRKKYKLRMILDESLTFGVLGARGRGLTEHLGVDRSEVDLISAGMEWAVSSIGGFCVGSSFIVDHQRISGIGYCFSASLPPLLTQAALTAIEKFEQQPQLFPELQDCCRRVDRKFKTLTKLTLRGDPVSPVKHLYLPGPPGDAVWEQKLLTNIVDECIDYGVALIASEYLTHMERQCPRPSIRLIVNRLLTDADIELAFNVVQKVVDAVAGSA
jgi:serine palmitoyltransferase